MKNVVKLNLGCGTKYLKGYINCDIATTVKIDKKVNLNIFPYPFKDNYADEILMDNVLEHLDDIPAVMEELYRITKADGKIILIVPYAKSEGALQDPTHKHFFTEHSLDYFTKDSAYGFYSHARFVVTARLFATEDTLSGKIRKYISFRKFLKRFLFNMYDGIYFELRPVKYY